MDRNISKYIQGRVLHEPSIFHSSQWSKRTKIGLLACLLSLTPKAQKAETVTNDAIVCHQNKEGAEAKIRKVGKD